MRWKLPISPLVSDYQHFDGTKVLEHVIDGWSCYLGVSCGIDCSNNKQFLVSSLYPGFCLEIYLWGPHLLLKSHPDIQLLTIIILHCNQILHLIYLTYCKTVYSNTFAHLKLLFGSKQHTENNQYSYFSIPLHVALLYTITIHVDLHFMPAVCLSPHAFTV